MSAAADLVSPAEVRDAVIASQQVWISHGEEPIVLIGANVADLGLEASQVSGVVALPNLRRLECHMTDSGQFATIQDAMRDLSQASWDVWIVLPARCLGSAHDSFRGLPVRLQGWWVDGQGNVKFGSDETP